MVILDFNTYIVSLHWKQIYNTHVINLWSLMLNVNILRLWTHFSIFYFLCEPLNRVGLWQYWVVWNQPWISQNSSDCLVEVGLGLANCMPHPNPWNLVFSNANLLCQTWNSNCASRSWILISIWIKCDGYWDGGHDLLGLNMWDVSVTLPPAWPNPSIQVVGYLAGDPVSWLRKQHNPYLRSQMAAYRHPIPHKPWFRCFT